MSRSLVFPDRRQQGRFPVLDERGAALGHITASWLRSSFSAVDERERPWCAGAADWAGLSGTWRVTGPDGGPLLVLRGRALRAQAAVELARGGTYAVTGSAWKRDFSVADDAGRTVVRAAPRTSAFSLHQYDYAVEVLDPGLTTTEVVALVQTWRMKRKADAAALS